MNEWLERQLIHNNIADVDPDFPLIYTNHFISRNSNHPEENPKVIGYFAPLNDLSKKFSFKGPSITKIPSWAAAYPLNTKVNLKNGCHNVRLEGAQRLLWFFWQGKSYCYLCIPLGILNGPMTFHVFIDVSHSLPPSEDQLLVKYYVDDIVCIGRTYA